MKVIPYEEVLSRAKIIPIPGEQLHIYDASGLELDKGVPYPRYIAITSHRILGIHVMEKSNILSYFLGLIGNFLKPDLIVEERFNIALLDIKEIRRAKFGANNALLDVYSGGNMKRICVKNQNKKYNFLDVVNLIANNIRALNPNTNIVINEDNMTVN